MVNKSFEEKKIKRELKRSGIDYEFKRIIKNEFEEADGEAEVIGKIKGIYHEETAVNGIITITVKDNVQVRSKKSPVILCLYEDTASLALKVGDIVEMANKTFKVVGISNIQEWSIIADISLEVIDDGLQA